MGTAAQEKWSHLRDRAKERQISQEDLFELTEWKILMCRTESGTRISERSSCVAMAGIQARFYSPDKPREASGCDRDKIVKFAKGLLCEHVYGRAQVMTETLSIRIDTQTKKRLDALAKRSRRSKSFLAAEAISAYVESEEWQLGELEAGIADLESGKEVGHERVSKWLNSWGKRSESKAPR